MRPEVNRYSVSGGALGPPTRKQRQALDAGAEKCGGAVWVFSKVPHRSHHFFFVSVFILHPECQCCELWGAGGKLFKTSHGRSMVSCQYYSYLAKKKRGGGKHLQLPANTFTLI